MKLGFTGSHEGMTLSQQLTVTHLIDRWAIEEVHHGDCIGSDAEFDKLAEERKILRTIHPGDKAALRAFCEGEIILSPKAYMTRNMHIVADTDKLLATPRNLDGNGGTWATINMARSFKKEVTVVNPDGAYTTYPTWAYMSF